MESKIMQVFYGNDCLPYKDRERQVHYPIVGNAFLGASNTTKIRFYFDYIGDSNTTWVSVAKLPNGKQGSRVLPIASDDDGNYAELELSNWYTQAKGDVYIALQGYQGGVQYEYDSETELYEIHGTPTIQTTGSIKIAINYAPIGDSADYNDEFTTYQEILAALGDKADADNVYDKTEVDTALSGKVDKLESTGTYVYTHNGSTQGQNIYTQYLVNNAIVQRDNNGEINVPTTPSDDSKATSKSYVVSEISSGLSTKQNTLVSGTNIKTINGQSILGSGDLPISGGGSAEWGAISGDIQEQTDLQNEFQDIRAEIAGRAQNISISYSQIAPINDADARLFKKFDNTAFTDLADFNSYVSGLTLANNSFYSTSGFVSIDQSKYIIDLGKKVIKATDIRDYYNVGNSNLFIIEQTYSNGDPLPDRWYAQLAVVDSSNFILIFNALESKVDVSGLATTGDLSIAQYEIEREIAPEYNPLTIYAIGDKVVYSHKLYTCTTAIETPETWDSTKWSQISVASGFVDLDKEQEITGSKTFANASLYFKYLTTSTTPFRIQATNDYQINLTRGTAFVANFHTSQGFKFNADVKPYTTETNNLGSDSLKWKDLYLSGQINIGNAVLDVASNNLRITLSGASAPQYLIASATFQPQGSSNDNKIDLGGQNRRWRDLYLSRNLSDGTNSATVADITNGIFNIINASDISNNTLTQAQYDLITNGKPTLIKGTFLSLTNILIETFYEVSSNTLCMYTSMSEHGCLNINKSSLSVSKESATIQRYNLRGISQLNGKTIPVYPSNTGTFTLKCVDGVLTWVED